MASNRGLVAGATAGSALALGVLVAAFSLPIDDFWLSLASADALRRGAPLDRAVDLTWTPMRPDALNPQWGAQSVLGAARSTWAALAVNALLIGGGLALVAIRTLRRASAEATAVAMLLAVGVLAPHLLARTQSFSILLLAVALLLLDQRPPRLWLPAAYGVLMVAWANLHGAFVIGQLAAVAVLVGRVLEARRTSGRVHVLPLALTAALALVAPVVNPAGVRLLLYAYAQPGLDVVRSISVEWQPSWPWIPVATLFWVLLALLVMARVLRHGGVGASDALLGIGLAVLAIGSIRHIPWFVIAMTPLLASDVDALLARLPFVARAFGRVPRALRGRTAGVLIAVGLLLAAAVQPLRPALPQQVGRVTPDAPVALADALEDRLRAGATARILNEQVWGGYLAHRFGERVETAMDGRLEIRDRSTWSAYFAMLRGDGSPAQELDAAGVEWAALAPERERLIANLREAGWSIEAQSAQGVLLRSPAP